MEKFSERLKSLRHSAGLTQKQLASILEVTERSYQRFEHNVRCPGIKTLIIISNYFNVSLDYLVGRSDNPKRL